LENALINYSVGWYGHDLSTNKEKLLKEVLNMKIKRNCSRGRLCSRWKQGSDIIKKEERAWGEGELRRGRSFGKRKKWRGLVVSCPT
jgi:hypothetical protein